MNKQKIVFRADGNSEIGLGHVIRSLALANMLKDNFECVFATRFFDAFVLAEIRNAGCKLQELPKEADDHFEKFIELLEGNEIVVLDNYFFDSEYQKQIKNLGCKLVCIDDLADKHFYADLIINPSAGVGEVEYSKESYTKSLLGVEYALLRPPFINNKGLKKANSIIPNSIIICFGGSDNCNLTHKVFSEVIESGFKENIAIVVGSFYSFKEDLISLINGTEGKIDLFENVSAVTLSELFWSHDIAIVPCSSVLLEAIACENRIITGAYIDNQKKGRDFFEKGEKLLIKDFFKSKICTADIFNAKKYQNAGNLDSPSIIRQAFINMELALNASIRLVDESDLDLVYHWANDIEVRSNAFNSDYIELDTHIKWFRSKLQDKNCRFLIMEFNNKPIGQIRFDIENEIATISYLLDSNYRGKNLGKTIIEKGVAFLLDVHKSNITIQGFVLEKNIASQKAFDANGFIRNTEENGVFRFSKTFR